MLVKRQPQQTNVSPFLYEGLATTPQQQQQAQQPPQQALPPESNFGRGLRRAGNACEIIAGSCLNSGVIFTFHLLQVHPVGFVLALGVSHFYLSATAAGEGKDRFATNVMTGASASLSLLCALSEPIAEWYEAQVSNTIAADVRRELYEPKQAPDSGLMTIGAIAFGLVVLFLFFGGRRK
ncbi:hypothetical protein ACN23B_30865 (plasmid) [Anabaena sp. FACHB-709]|uniref:hypothetical protein n=1 Tax=Nostocaceae TaxID=1162 RepID=UPI00000CF06F|nr:MULTISPECIES: hypothetical protein [Nostocaceae]HBW29103.1 hypothetical protein [Nostoc sp. UBA8866]MBD2266802.1 hypothetical protein [Anabaena sp. FACHB-709]MBD2276396.1 hypothetical protein [Nostoc sp. PCC 7120 = FACHB-418]RUR78638.1 hypothetical protein DSM107007_42510 [Nostoc sp. PCC 7120 = FACHB-418]BAB77497.1 alr9011 [Nostoc sp. PCC 7120 = FACHB-418]